MKKWMILSLGLSLALAAPFAFADDTGQTTTGQTGQTMGSDPSGTTTGTTTGSTTTTERETKTSKSCTDSSGTTYQQGEKGYQTCMKTMSKHKRSDQMGGQTGEGSR